jgi:hypothetical protein
LTSTFTYDPMNRLTELSMPPIADYKYMLGLTGNRTNATEQSGRALAWNYDGIYRLTNETISGDPANNSGNNGSAAYTLDPVGNRTSPQSRRNYRFAMDQFIAWYCSEPRLALNRTVVLRFRLYLESLGLAAATINQRLAAVRRLAYEAADSGLLSPELAAGIRRVKGVKHLGQRSGNCG